MKKLLIVFFLLVLNFTLKAQYPILQQLGSNNTLIRLGTTYGGALKGNLVQGVYADTTEANSGYIDAYPGAIIFTTGNSTMYVRNAAATGWISLATGLSAINIYTSDGTLTGNRILAGSGQSLEFTGLSDFLVDDVTGELVLGTSESNRLRISSGFTAFVSIDADSVLMTRLPQSQLLSTDSFLIRTADFKLKTRAVSSIGGTYTAGNGLTLSGSQFQLGGALSRQTIVSGSWLLGLTSDTVAIGNSGTDITVNSASGDITLNSPNGKYYMVLPESGSATDSVLTWESATNQVKKRNVASLVSTPTLQEVLTAGSTLTTSNVINTGANTLNIIGGDSDKNYLIINPTINSESSDLRAFNTATTSYSRVKVSTSNTAISSQLESDWGDGLVVSRFENNVNSSTAKSIITSYEEDGKLSEVIVDKDSVKINPSQGIANIDSLRSFSTVADTLYKKPMTWDTRNGRWEYFNQWPQQKINLVFGAGSGADADTTAFTTAAIYGSFFNDADTIVVTSMRGVLQGTSASVTYQVWYNDSLNVEAGGTKLVTAGSALTNTTTGTNVTSFDVTKIPPGNWVWVKTSVVTTKPKYFSLTLNGYRK